MAVSPDPRFIAYEVFEHYFVNKMTGRPLAGGVVTFYKDNDRTVKKPVYQLTGSPPNYSFSVLPNPCILSAVGTFQDGSGNNIVPYFLPYDDQGNIELYYITVTSAFPGLVPQFVRPAMPPGVEALAALSNGDEKNFITNGQFLVHNDIISSTNPPITSVDGIDIQPIAQGGWFFKRSTGGASTFANEFVRLSTSTSGANDFPRYAFNFICQSYDASDEVRDLCYVWNGVYTFSGGNPPGTNDYTFMTEGVSLDSNIYTYQLIMTQNFGTGGSPSAPIETVLGTIVTTDSFTYFVKNMITFPADSGTLGDNDDDYVSLSLRGPASSFRSQFRCFVLAIGTQVFTFYPPETNDEVIAEAVFGALPTPTSDGSDLYLKVQYTQTGMIFDTSEIGNLVFKTTSSDFVNSISTTTNELLTDGNPYITANYSPLGIPFKRLQSKLWDSTINMPTTGTGSNFVTAYTTAGASNILRLTTNEPGSQTAAADGTIPTGFTFQPVITGNSTYALKAYVNNSTAANVLVEGDLIGAVVSASAGTSGFTITQLLNSSNTYQLFDVAIASLPTAGTYFLGSNTTTNYYFWFTINGSGADPAVGGRTGVLIPLLSTDSINDAASIIRSAISGFQVVNITTVAASAIPAGAWFTFHAAGNLFAPYYKIAGVGNAPSVLGTPIEVVLTGTETNAQVLTATQIAINSYQYAVPNTQGLMIKGWTSNPSTTLDLDLINRYKLIDVPAASDNLLNSYQSQAVQELLYNQAQSPAVDGGVASVNFLFSGGEGSSEPHFVQINQATTIVGQTKGPETRPQNFYANIAIKY